jgi:hypothetical protein
MVYQRREHGSDCTAAEPRARNFLRRRAVQYVAGAMCALGILVATRCGDQGSGGGAGRMALEGPWTPDGEDVMKPGLTFHQMKALHGQLQQVRWASRFGSDRPKQVCLALLRDGCELSNDIACLR